MTQSIPKDKLPDGAKIWIVEKGPFKYDPGTGDYSIIVFDVDGETGALSVVDICRCDRIADGIDTLLNSGINGINLESAWVPTPEGEYLQPGASLPKALEAALGLPAWHDPPPTTEQLIGQAAMRIARLKEQIKDEELAVAELEERLAAEVNARRRNADHVDGYDRDDLGASPDY